ncbi:DNA polymerase III subunit gamma and tau [Microbacterium karelineae]|uniref:DNA polymerase III subunit gamma and tau n=1 Tax=Microbacterium karelineae TaxID=2654283 RepID=UPI0012E9C690|nr:DNA polymerase III subunit gamma and tau [Microbacterium karelineae]
MSTALYRRYRPETFSEMIGQSQVTEPLMTALRSDRIGHAYLFSGPRGCGKTTSARILARCLNCAEGPTDTPCGTCDSCVELSRAGGGSLDVVEIDAASHNGVDDARDLRERAIFAPARDRFKIFILDEAHMVTAQGFNALLKLVEEPPAHVKFIFATTEPDKVIGTIRSRTHHYPFRLVPPAAMLEYIEQLCAQEGTQPDAGVLPLVVRAGAGSPRDTLSILDQLIAGSEGTTVGYERAVALLGYTHAALLDEVVDAFAGGDAATAFAAVDRVVQTGQDPRRFVDDLLERLRDLIVIAATGDQASSVLRGLPSDELERMQGQAQCYGAARLSRTADVVSGALDQMTGATSPRLQLELMIARVLTEDGAAGSAASAAPAPAPAAASTTGPPIASPAAGQSAPPTAPPVAASPLASPTAEPGTSPAGPPAATPHGAPAADPTGVETAPPTAAPRAADPDGASTGGSQTPAAAPAASPAVPSGDPAVSAAPDGAPTASPAAPAASPAGSPAAPGAPAAAPTAPAASPTAASAAPPTASPAESRTARPTADPAVASDARADGAPSAGDAPISGTVVSPGERDARGVGAPSDLPVVAPAGPPESDDVPAAAWAVVAPGQGAARPADAPPIDDEPPADDEPPVDDVAGAQAEARPRPAGAPAEHGATASTGAPPEGSARSDAANAGASSDELTLDGLRAAWPGVLAAIERTNRASWLVLQSAAPAHVAGDVVGLAFTNPSDLGQFKTRAPDGSGVSEDLRAAIIETLGSRVKFLAKHIPSGPDSPGGPPPAPGGGPSGPVAGGDSSGPAPGGGPTGPAVGGGSSAPADSGGQRGSTPGGAPSAQRGDGGASSAPSAPSDPGTDTGLEAGSRTDGSGPAGHDERAADTPATAPVASASSAPSSSPAQGTSASAGAHVSNDPPPPEGSASQTPAPAAGARSDAGSEARPASSAPASPAAADAPEPAAAAPASTAPADQARPATSGYAAAPAAGWAVAPIPNADAAPPAAAAPPPFAGPATLAVDADPGEALSGGAPTSPRDGDVIDDVPPELDDEYPPDEPAAAPTPTVQARQVRLDEGVQRYGEAVVRQKLGARFLHEEEYTPPTRFQ